MIREICTNLICFASLLKDIHSAERLCALQTGVGITHDSIIIIIMTFQGTIRDFLRLQHVCSSGPSAIVCKSCATHRAFITCNMSCYVPHVRRDSSAIKFDRVYIAFI